jgi:hypothetical protein
MDKNAEELYNTAVKAHDIVYKTQTVFPFTLFPDTISIDREKVTVANRFFFRVATVISTPIADIKSIESNVGPFFGSLKITSEAFTNNVRIIKFLSREDSIKIQRIIQGFMISRQKEIDVTKIETHELITMMMELGRGGTD